MHLNKNEIWVKIVTTSLKHRQSTKGRAKILWILELATEPRARKASNIIQKKT